MLLSDCSCKGEDNKITAMLYFIYKTVKSSHLKKIQIILNINNLIFQAIVAWGLMIEPGGGEVGGGSIWI